MKAPTDSLSGGPAFWFMVAVYVLCPHVAEKNKETHWVFFYTGTNPFYEGSALMT